MFKKRWSDGIEDIYFGKDEFEIKFSCFGGDGGGNTGGGDDKKISVEDQNKRAEDQEPVRGRSSGLFNSAPVTETPKSFGSIADMDAGLRSTQNNITQQASLTSPASLSGRGYAPDLTAGQSYANSLTSTKDVMGQARDISIAQQNLNDYLGGGLPQGGYNTERAGLSFGLPQGASLKNPGLQVNYAQRFGKGGVVNQGIGSVFPYPKRTG